MRRSSRQLRTHSRQHAIHSTSWKINSLTLDIGFVKFCEVALIKMQFGASTCGVSALQRPDKDHRERPRWPSVTSVNKDSRLARTNQIDVSNAASFVVEVSLHLEYEFFEINFSECIVFFGIGIDDSL